VLRASHAGRAIAQHIQYDTCPEFVIDVASARPALESLEADDARIVVALQPGLGPFMLERWVVAFGRRAQ